MFNLFHLSLKLSGFPIAKAQSDFEKILQISETDYPEYLEKKKREIVSFHLKNNAFYSELVGKDHFENWNELPVMTKKDLQKPLKERLSNGYAEKNVFVNKTSGSSGNPLVFARDRYCHALIWANIIRRFGWYGIDFNYSLQARFYGIPLDFISNKKIRFKDFLSRRYRFNVFDFSDEKIEKMIEKFRTTKFDYINGYTSSIVLLAHYLKRNNLFLNDICPTLKICVVTSEMLFDEDKRLLEERFRIPIINEFGSAELEIMAFENPNGIWEANSETLFIEILDEYNQPLPFGKEGKIVVTSLYNQSHPFIRYDVGDIGVLDEKSTLKNPILKKLLGRTNDIAILPSGKKSPGMTFYSITKKLFDDDGNVKEFIIIQTKIDSFEIQYVSEKELSSQQILEIEKIFKQYLEDNLNFIFIRKQKLIRTKSGKLKQFVSMI